MCRWLAGLSPDKQHAVSLATLRERACRIERVDELRDPSVWMTPRLVSEGVVFPYADAPQNTMTLGSSSYSFSLSVSERGEDSIYVYNDYIRAVGLVTDAVPYEGPHAETACRYITPGRTVTPRMGQTVVLMNDEGCLCFVKLTGVKRERNDDAYQKPEIVFDYRILAES